MGDSTQTFRSPGRHPTGDYPRHDTALLDRLRAGDDSALSALHERHVRAVYGVVTDRLGAQPVAVEVTHDVFLVLWRKARRIKLAGTSCLPWLVVTADSLARDLSRAERQRRKKSASAGGGGSDPGAHGCRSAGWREVERIVSTFMWADREVFRLCADEGLSYREAVRRVLDIEAERRVR